MKTRRVGSALFCDDIRREIGNKLSLIGAYGGEIVFSAKPPILLPKFSCFVNLISDVGDPPKHIVFRVTIPDADKSLEIIRHETTPDGNIQNLEGAVALNFGSFIEMSQIVLTHPGFIEVWADVDGESFRCGRIRVIFFDGTPQP